MTLDEFLALFPSANTRRAIEIASQDAAYLVAYNKENGSLACSAYTDKPDEMPDNVVAIWSKIPKSRTMQAVELITDEGLTVYAAAKQVGVNQSAVHRAIKRRDGKDICPSCGRVMRAFA